MPTAFPGIRGQTQPDDYIDFSNTITTGGTAQIVVPQQLRRLSLYFQNISVSDSLFLGYGPPTPVATLTGTQVTSIANAAAAGGGAGIGFTVIPQVIIAGGIIPGDYQTSPQQVGGTNAVAHVNGLSGTGGITGFTIDNPGSGYVIAPLVLLVNNPPQLGGGACIPTASIGISIPPQGFFSMGGSLLVPGSAMWVYGATTGDEYICKIGLG